MWDNYIRSRDSHRPSQHSGLELGWSTVGLGEVGEPGWWSTEVLGRETLRSWEDHHNQLLTHSLELSCKQVSLLFAAKPVD